MIPGISGHAVKPVFGKAGKTKFRRVGFTDDDCTGCLEPGNLYRIILNKIVLKGYGAKAGDHAPGIFHIFNANGNAGQRTGIHAGGDSFSQTFSFLQCVISPQGHKGIEGWVHCFDSAQG